MPRIASRLDEASTRIIAMLQKDGRTSYAAMAKEVGLSEAAVRQRVQKMVETGVMQIVAVTNPLEIGFARQAMVGIKASGDLSKVADTIGTFDAVDYVVITAGRFDVLAEIVCVDDDHLLDVRRTIGEVDGVESTEVLLYLKLAKQTYDETFTSYGDQDPTA